MHTSSSERSRKDESIRTQHDSTMARNFESNLLDPGHVSVVVFAVLAACHKSTALISVLLSYRRRLDFISLEFSCIVMQSKRSKAGPIRIVMSTCKERFLTIALTELAGR